MPRDGFPDRHRSLSAAGPRAFLSDLSRAAREGVRERGAVALARVAAVRSRLVWCAALAWLTVSAAGSGAQADEPTGEQIYRQMCAACHGEQGQGVADHYNKPLVGDRTVAELAKTIAETMPEGEPEKCVGPEAEQVAQYVYDAFYSEIAQMRNRPARVEFSRLTVRQHEQAVADLLRSFRGWEKRDDERGLSAQYFNSRNFNRDKRVIERRDATVDFDFGDGSPEADKIGKEEFSAKWEGSLLAPETGVYEFIVETHNGARLWVNDEETPVVDAWVRSGDGTVFRGSTRLLGGRIYPLRLEFFKFKEPRASIRLKWRAPFHAEEVIPASHLSPHGSSSTFVLQTPFPPDDRSTGFERGTSVSPAWNEATTFAAIETAAYVGARLRELMNVRREERTPEKVQEFCRQFAERAFRRPLSAEERELYVDRQFAESPNVEAAVKRTVLLTLKSPRFLYREAGVGEFDDYDVASWLSFTLWDSLPDRPLLDAAARGELKQPEQIRRQAERMVGDPRARSKLLEFLHQWLKLDQLQEIAKDREHYPGFDAALVSDLRRSLDLFLMQKLWEGSGDVRQLFLADTLVMNRRMADFYGVPEAVPATESGFQPVSFEPERRAGVLSHPYLMAAFAYNDTTSPIHRGVWLSRNVLGRILNPPPIAVAPIAPSLHADLTTRERVILQTSPGACVKCHTMINALGFPMEQFDAVGRYREQENGKPIDPAGHYVTRDGGEVQFAGVRELATFLADSPEVHQAFTDRVFQYFVKQPVRAFGDGCRERLKESFASRGFDVRQLLVEAATTSATAMRSQPAAETNAE